MAIVSDILGALDAEVTSLLPAYKKSKFTYFIEKNNRVTSKKIYTIRPDSGKSAVGTTLSATFDQNFDVILSDIFQDKNDSDKDLADKILALHTDVETLYIQLFQKRLGLTSAQVLLVSLVDISAPEVDVDNSTVSLTATFGVKYRSQIY
jgi:hypothetical protein